MSDRRNCSAITSMNPSPLRAERQLLCIQSWLNAGLRVIVVNTTEELSAMSLPDGVETAACDDLSTLYDRKTQLVSSLVRAGIETGGTFMLINSDIEISGDLTLLDEALKTPQELTIGIRYNHRPGEKKKAHLETSGLDVFLMTPELAATLPDAPFGIGKPVWDYWIPQHFRSLGVKFNWIRRPLFFHESHELGWSWEEWQQGADYILEKYGVVLGYGSNEFRRSLDKNISTEPVIVAESCKCELTGFCEARGIALRPTFQMLCRENKPRLDAILAGQTWTQPKATAGPQRKSCSTKNRGKCSNCSNAGTLMLAAIQTDTGQPVSCGSCKTYLLSLNRMSSHDHAAIVQKLYAEISWPQSWRAANGDKEGQRKRIGEIVSGVLAAATTKCETPKPVRRTASTRKSNQQLYNEMLAAPKPARDPFRSEPVFHFGAHLWPIVGCWEAHVDEWNKLASQITGRCIVGIAECNDCGTSPTSEVIARLSHRFEVFTVPNTKEGENPTFTELVRRMPKGENDIFLYAHGKGMKPATRVSAAVKTWIQVMYSTVIFNHGEIVRRIAQGYKTFGSLRAFGKAPLSPAFSWHYAGTFFAVRSKHMAHTKPVKSGYGGVEAWPGNNFPANEAWCEFGDNRAIMSHYDAQEMCSGVVEGAVRELAARNARRHCHRKLIAVTTCNLHGSEEIRNDIVVTLDSIAEHCASDVLVVDDGSPIEYQDYVRDLCKRRGFRFVGIWNNGGISHAKNLCLSEFLEDRRYEYLIMLDDDVKVLSDEFESTYTTAMERNGVGILSWHDPAYTGAAAEPDGELMASGHTCGCCVVVSRECAKETGLYNVMPGKWGREHSEYYQRAAVKFGKPGVYLDVPNSKDLLVIASNASVFTHEEKLASSEINRIYLGAES